MTEQNSQWTIPQNSLSCFIGRVCEKIEPDQFKKDGVLWVDFYDLNGDKNSPNHDEDGTTHKKVIASWTLRAAYTAWEYPPAITYQGNLNCVGTIKISDADITLDNATLSNVSISGGPPLQGTTTCGMGPGTAVVPVNISSASGSAKISTTQKGSISTPKDETCEINIHTSGDSLNITLIPSEHSQVPWCANPDSSKSVANINEKGKIEDMNEVDIKSREHFIQEGDKVLCMAFGNSYNNLYAVDIFI